MSTLTAAAAAKVPLSVFRGATGSTGSAGSTSSSISASADVSMTVKAGTWTDMSRTPHWLTGLYHRWAQFTAGSGVGSYGVGTFMSPLHTSIFLDGGWETSYFVASRFTPDAANSTNCCCEYISQGPGWLRVLADYCVTAVPHSAHLPLE